MPAGFNAPPKIVRAYVVFQDAVDRTDRPWWDVFTAPAWRHCWVMLPVYWPEPGLMASVFTQKIEPLRWGLDVAVWWEKPEIVAGHFYSLGVTAIVAVTVTLPHNGGLYIPRGLFNCVTICKAALGLRAWKVWTPRQLFAYLVRDCGGALLQWGEGESQHESDRINFRGSAEGRATGAEGA